MNEEYIDSTNEISLLDLYNLIKRNILSILLFTGLFFAAATFYAFTIADTQYKSNADVMIQIEVNPENNTFDFVNAQRLISTVAELLSKDIILDEALMHLDTELTPRELRRNLSVTSAQNSFFINISYVDEDPEFAKEVVNEVINAAILLTNTDDSFSSLSNTISRTSFAQTGTFDSPNRLLYMVIGAILGGIVGLGFVFLKEFFRNTYTSREQIEAAFGIQVLGVIPKFESKERKSNGKKKKA